ncbi:hypothetical protein I302_108780 [Kwoniella bestiolae CBS 10118]|uniref:Uncharacterized protein n=1 Tax=Kwoniella bestiolae CBS 10118 TaxID=1296100 RepID=A0A1B9FU41_9TREE|nr:hypothetical protein I302_07917 [Kwoniella bestiolae CBS 10118]OCF22272.1 hypothetical protein I302_07917 [Kwoniella bestiolae CBS 10118]
MSGQTNKVGNMRKFLMFKLRRLQLESQLPPIISTLSIPPDLFPLILSHITDQSTLHSLSLTTRYFNILATPVLYQHVYLGSGTSVERFILNAPLHHRKNIKTLHLHFDLSKWNTDTYKFQHTNRKQVNDAKLDKLDKLIVTSTGPQHIRIHKKQTYRDRRLSDVFDDWALALCPTKGPVIFEGRYIDSQDEDTDDDWLKGPLFHMINYWTNLKYLDVPIMLHPQPPFTKRRAVGLLPPEKPLMGLKEIRINSWDRDQSLLQGGLLIKWLDDLAYLIGTEREKERRTGVNKAKDDKEEEEGIVLRISEPTYGDQLEMLERWVEQRGDRARAFVVARS